MWLALCLAAPPAFFAPAWAEVWGYVDPDGRTHLGPDRVDERYRLFFKGDLAPPPGSTAAPAASNPAPAEARPPVPDTTAVLPAVADGGGRYAELIDEQARRHAVDPVLVRAIVAVESGFRPGAVSPKGALGLMQVMPATAARYGVAADDPGAAARKLFDPATNVAVGTRHLRDLLQRYGDDVTLALAAYNAGEFAVERHRNRVPPYPETQAYVQRVQALVAAWRPPVPVVLAPPPVDPARRQLRGRLLPSPGGSGGAAP